MDRRILIVGNAPLSSIPNGQYDVVFYFANNSQVIRSISAGCVFGVIQNFTIDTKQWDCPKWGKIRKDKFIKYKTFFKSEYETILIGKLDESNSKFKTDFNVVEQLTHKRIVLHVLKVVYFLPLVRAIGLRGCVNYLLLIFNLKSTISGKYRPSSGYFIALYALVKYKNVFIDFVGFSNPNEAYIVTSDLVLEKSPHSKVDSLIFNQLSKKRFIL